MKKILLIVATHGNERIGLDIVKKLKQKELDTYFDVLIGNPKALKQDKRFLEADLNRSYPGDIKSPIYEVRRATKNLKIAKKYKYVIDLHEASQGINDFIIVPRKTFTGKFPVDFIELDSLLLWPDPEGPLSQILENAIELEFGMKGRNRETVIDLASDIVITFINNVYKKSIIKIYSQSIYYVYGTLPCSDTPEKMSKLIDFKKTIIGKETFFPLLTNQYLDLKIKCYKMRKIK